MRRRRILFLLLAVVLLAIVFRGVLLRGVGAWLVVDGGDAFEIVAAGTAGNDVAVMIVSGDQAENVAGRLLSANDTLRCLLFNGRRYRTEQLGVTPPSSEIREQELRKQGFDDDQITIFDGADQPRWEHVEQWMNEHPDTMLVVLCDEFSSRITRSSARGWLSDSVFARIRLHPIPDRRFGKTDWWKNRLGIRHVSACYLSLVFAVFNPQAPEPVYRNPDEYEDWFLTSAGLVERSNKVADRSAGQ